MGHAEGCSMLYLEARCLLVTRGAGSQGVQNGSISCIALPESLPGGVRAVLAENLLAAMLGLEVRLGQRRAGLALGHPQDGQADAPVHPRHRLHLLRLQRHAAARQPVRRRQLRRRGLRRLQRAPARHAGGWRRAPGDGRGGAGGPAAGARRRSRRSMRSWAFPPSPTTRWRRRRSATAATTCRSATPVADLAAADRFLAGDLGDAGRGRRAAAGAASTQAAANILEMGRQRVAGDYLQPAAIFDRDVRACSSAINDPNDYAGPGTRLPRWTASAGRRSRRSRRRNRRATSSPPHIGRALAQAGRDRAGAAGHAARGDRGGGSGLRRGARRAPSAGCAHEEVLAAILSGVAEEGLTARMVKVYASSDLRRHRPRGRAAQRLGHRHRAAIARHDGDPQARTWRGSTTWSSSRSRPA